VVEVVRRVVPSHFISPLQASRSTLLTTITGTLIGNSVSTSTADNVMLSKKRDSVNQTSKPEQMMTTSTIAVHMFARGVSMMRRHSAGMMTKLSLSSRAYSVTSVACYNTPSSSRKDDDKSNSRFTTRPNSRCSSSGSVSESSESVQLSPFQVSGEEEDNMMKEFFELAKKNDDAGVEELVESHKFLLIHEAINTTDSFGNSPIMIAAQRNWSEVIVQLQCNQYCDVNHQNFFGSSALMCSASHGHLDALRVLCNNPKTGTYHCDNRCSSQTSNIKPSTHVAIRLPISDQKTKKSIY